MRLLDRSRTVFLFPLAAIVVSAFVLATTTSSVLGAVLVHRPGALEAGVDEAPQEPLPAVEPMPEARSSAPVPVEHAPVGSTHPAPSRPLQHSALPFAVAGTLISRNPAWSLATVVDTRDGSVHTWMVGDVVDGEAKVAEIARAQVTLERGDGRELVDAVAPRGGAMGSAIPARTLPAPAGASGETSTLGAHVREISPGQFSVPKDDLEAVIGGNGMSEAMTSMRVLPNFENGTSSGFKVAWVKPGSVYTRLGLQPGDVVKRINGYSLDSPEKALELYAKLRDARRVDLELERNGARLTRTYTIE